MEGFMKKGIEIISRDGRRIVKGLGYYEPRVVGDLRELVKGSAERYGDRPAFKIKDKDGRITHKTYKELDSDVDCLGTALASLGLKGMRMSIIGENRYEWGVSYFAAVNGVGIAVPLDRHLPQNEAENLIGRGRVDVIFYSPAYHEMMLDIAGKNAGMKYFFCMEKILGKTVDDPKFVALPDLIEKGRKLLDAGDKSFTGADIDR
jgi:long-chain acyl-CoA synthetase